MRRSNGENISSLIAEYIRENGLAEGLLRVRVFHAYKEAVGESIANATVNKYYRDKTLYCTISSSVLRYGLYREINGVIEKINTIMGAEAVKKIVLK